MTKDEVLALAMQAQIFLHHEDEMDLVGVSEVLRFAELVVAAEQDRCCSIVFGQCGSDNVAQRTVDAIRGKA